MGNNNNNNMAADSCGESMRSSSTGALQQAPAQVLLACLVQSANELKTAEDQFQRYTPRVIPSLKTCYHVYLHMTASLGRDWLPHIT